MTPPLPEPERPDETPSAAFLEAPPLSARESVHFIRRLMHLAPDIVYVYDFRTQKLLYVNQRLTDLLGYTEADLPGLGHSLVNLVIEPEPAQLGAYITRRFAEATDGETIEYEFTVRHKDGSVRVLRNRSSVLRRDAAGQPVEVVGISEDITTERQVRDELRRREAQLAESQRLFHYGSWEWEVGTDLVRWSDELVRIFGYDPARISGPMPFGFYFDHIPSDEREQVEALTRQIILTRQPILEFEHTIITPTGERKRLRVRGSVLRDETDRVVAFSGTSADITAEHEDAERVRRSEALFNETEALARAGSWEWEFDAATVRWSEGLFRLLGYNPADFPGNRVATDFYEQHLADEDRERVLREAFDRLNQGLSYEIEHWVTARTGQRLRVCLRGSVLPPAVEGGPQRVVGHALDMTDRYQAEAHLRETEAIRHDVERFFGQGSWVWDLTGAQDSLYWSEGNSRLFGYGPEEIPHGQVSLDFLLRHIHPDDREAYQTATREALRKHEPTFTIECRIVTKSGEIKHTLRRARLILDEKGHPLRYVGTNVDVTDERRLTESLRRSEGFNRRLIELSPDYISIYDLKTGRAHFVGRHLRTLLGYSEAEVEKHGGTLYFALAGPDDWEAVRDYAAKMPTLADYDFLTYKVTMRAKDGRRVVVQSRSTVFRRDDDGRVAELMSVNQDVTEAEVRAEALRQSEHFNRQVLRLSPDYINTFDLQTQHIRHLGRQLWADLGYAEEELVEGSLMFALAEEDRPVAAAVLEKVRTLADGDYVTYQNRLRAKSGELRTYHCRTTVFRREADGTPAEIMVVAQDVTEAKAQAEALRRGEAFNRRLVELSPDIISVFDLPTQRMRYVGTRTLRQLLGFSDEEVERDQGTPLGGTPLGRFWDEAEAQYAQDLIREICTLPDGETRAYTVRVRHKQGHAVTLFVRSSVFSRDETGQPRELMSVTQDVTLREQLFQQLQLRDDLLAEAQNLLQFGGWELHAPGEDAYWTPGLYRVMGHDPDSLPAEQSTTALFMAVVHPDDAPVLAERFGHAFATGEGFSYEYRFQWPNGEWRLHAGRGRGFISPDGRIRLVGATADVTDERRLFQQLQRSEALLSQTEASLQFGSWEWDVPTRQITWSAGLWRIFGYDDREIPHSVTTGLFFSHLHPDDRAMMEAVTRNAFTQREPFGFEYRITDAHGRARLLAGRGVPLFDENGRLSRLVGNTRDVTEEKQAAEALKKTEVLLSEAEASLAMGTWDWNVATGVVAWSPGQWRIFGYEEKDAPPTSLDLYYRHVHPDDRARMEHVLSRAVAEARPFQFEYRAVTVPGDVRLIQGRGVPVFDQAGRLVRFLGNNIDVTAERKTAEQVRKQELLLRESEILLRFGSWEWDLPEGTLRWSEGLYTVFGYGADNRPNPLTIDVFNRHVHPDEAGENARLQNLILTEKPATFDSEFRILTAEGEERWLHQRGLTHFDETGQLLRMIGSTADVTELRTNQLALEQRLNDLNRSNAELEQFAYVASHDLQEPLRKITAFGGRLATKHAADLSAEGQLYLERMIAAGTRMQALIDNLLGFSRVARQVGDAVPTDLNATLRSVLSDLELKIAEKQARVDVGPLPTLTAIPSQMHQLFQNLLTNAIKFGRPGEPPLIRVRSEYVSTHEKVRHHLDLGKKYARVTVQDNGIGFDPVYAEKIFDLFQRLHGRSEYEGTGLGLAIVKKIVENHHGTIFAESTPGQGAVFTVFLPLEP